MEVIPCLPLVKLILLQLQHTQLYILLQQTLDPRVVPTTGMVTDRTTESPQTGAGRSCARDPAAGNWTPATGVQTSMSFPSARRQGDAAGVKLYQKNNEVWR